MSRKAKILIVARITNCESKESQKVIFNDYDLKESYGIITL